MISDSSFWVGPATAPETYELVAVLGGGGEGEVWRAILPLSNAGRRPVAVKIMRGTGNAATTATGAASDTCCSHWHIPGSSA